MEMVDKIKFNFAEQGDASIRLTAEQALTIAIHFDDDHVIATALAVLLFNDRRDDLCYILKSSSTR